MALKINNSSGDRMGSRRINSKLDMDNKKVEGSNNKGFNGYMMNSSGHAQEDILLQMANDIINQGKRLTDKVDISELKAYKRLVSEFLQEAVRGSGKFVKESFLDRRGRHRVYATVKTVNKKLEELTEQVLNTEKDNLKIVNTIEDIRGMILDLIL